ncbi:MULTISPECIES: tyrosine-type recombinase/integrase [Giesbergeria]|uniref:Tyrosine-type recombinase/integrase n=1 Tax=Giesbergeria sinuosa TaxID=80883 RepID=A0ABV9QHK9_9BURK
MARPKKADTLDTTQSIELTAGAIERLSCPSDKQQVFLRDSKAPGLRVRVTAAGAKSYVFERKLHRQTIRRTIGDVRDWSIEQARAEARRLGVLLDNGQDPREIERQQQAEREATKAAAAADAVTMGQAWTRYLEQRRPFWGELNYRDHLQMVQPGGQERARLPGTKTMPGPLVEFLPLRLVELTAPVIEMWANKEAQLRPARLRLALRLLKAFLRWTQTEPDLGGKADPNAASAKKTREIAGKAQTKNDYLQREQLPAWFQHVCQLQNPVISAYLQVLLLTGARREELAELKWDDVNFQWRGIDMKDKAEGRRAVPLTPYVAQLLSTLPRRNEWVFSSPTSASGRLQEPSIAHRQACRAAGLDKLTLHGLRRSFASLCEWLDIPGGISAQIQGHAPQGVREQNYIRRPLDLLRVHHERIEAWILEQARVPFDAQVQPSRLRMVAN